MSVFLYMTLILCFSWGGVGSFFHSQGDFYLFVAELYSSHIQLDSLESLLYLFFKESIAYKS